MLYGVGGPESGADIQSFPQFAAKVMWTDIRDADGSFLALVGVFGSVDDSEGVPIPDFGQATFCGPVEALSTPSKKMQLKKSFDRGGAGELVTSALGHHLAL